MRLGPKEMQRRALRERPKPKRQTKRVTAVADNGRTPRPESPKKDRKAYLAWYMRKVYRPKQKKLLDAARKLGL